MSLSAAVFAHSPTLSRFLYLGLKLCPSESRCIGNMTAYEHPVALAAEIENRVNELITPSERRRREYWVAKICGFRTWIAFWVALMGLPAVLVAALIARLLSHLRALVPK
jgi:hypothetical protein